jgi:hypothetical protein
VKMYPSIKAAARCAGVWPSQMQRVIKRAQVQEGCVWRFSEDGVRDAEAREGRGGEEEVGWGREEGVEGMEEGEGAEEEEEKECSVCRKMDASDMMLLCDGCDRGWHLFCLDPPLENVPHGAWYCPVCIQGGPGDLDMFIPARTLDERAEGREGGGEEAKEAASEPLKISGIGGKKAGCARVKARGRGVESVDMLQVGPDA